MILTGTGKYVRESHPSEVTAYKEDGYADLARKAAEALDITVPDSGALVLLRPTSGAVIPTQLKDDKVSWTLGGFLRQHHFRADKVEVGVACAVEASKGTHSEPAPVSSNNDVTVWYAHIGDPDEITRSTVWLQFDSDLQMDEDAPFHPETLGYTVVRVLKCTPEGEVTLLEPGSAGQGIIVPGATEDFAVVHSSPSEITLTSLRKAYPLYCLMSHHSDTHYQWQLLEQSDVELPSSPVVHIKQAGIYKCTAVWGSQEKVMMFSVRFKPGLSTAVHVQKTQTDSVQGRTMQFGKKELEVSTLQFDLS